MLTYDGALSATCSQEEGEERVEMMGGGVTLWGEAAAAAEPREDGRQVRSLLALLVQKYKY
jgi:hypothetical protein